MHLQLYSCMGVIGMMHEIRRKQMKNLSREGIDMVPMAPAVCPSGAAAACGSASGTGSAVPLRTSFEASSAFCFLTPLPAPTPKMKCQSTFPAVLNLRHQASTKSTTHICLCRVIPCGSSTSVCFQGNHLPAIIIIIITRSPVLKDQVRVNNTLIIALQQLHACDMGTTVSVYMDMVGCVHLWRQHGPLPFLARRPAAPHWRRPPGPGPRSHSPPAARLPRPPSGHLLLRPTALFVRRPPQRGSGPSSPPARPARPPPRRPPRPRLARQPPAHSRPAPRSARRPRRPARPALQARSAAACAGRQTPVAPPCAR